MRATKSLYGNCIVMTGDVAMFRCDDERKAWYLSMGLAEVVSESPPVIRLTFQPKGPGHAGDPYFLQEFKNRCVVCGTDDGLSHHHIVPYCYRRYFPKDSYDYGRWFYDVLLLCLECHHSYEEFAHQLKHVIAHEHGVPAHGLTTVNRDEAVIMKAAAALHRHWESLPVDRKLHFEGILKAYLGKESLDREDPSKVFDVLRRGISTTTAGEIVVRKLQDHDAFAIRWRKHFLRHMKPAYLPDLWDPERRIYSEGTPRKPKKSKDGMG